MNKLILIFGLLVVSQSGIATEIVSNHKDEITRDDKSNHRLIATRYVFGKEIETRVKKLIDLEDTICIDDQERATIQIEECRNYLKDTQLWFIKYSNDTDVYIRTAAQATLSMFENDEKFLDLVLDGVATGSVSKFKAALLKKNALRSLECFRESLKNLYKDFNGLSSEESNNSGS